MTEWHPTNRFADPLPEGPLPGALRTTSDKADLLARYHARVAKEQIRLHDEIHAIREQRRGRFDTCFREEECTEELSLRLAKREADGRIIQARQKSADTRANLRDQCARDIVLLQREEERWMHNCEGDEC